MSAPLRQRTGIVALLSAHGLAQMGTSMSFIAIPWLVLSAGGSATTVGAVTLAEMLPYVLVQGLGGPLVDRIGAWRTSVLTDLSAAAALGIVPLCNSAHALSLPLLMTAIAFAGAFRGAGDIARRVMLPRVSSSSGTAIDRSIGLFDGAGRLAGMIGGPLAGVLVAVSSAAWVIAIDAGTFLLSAMLVALKARPVESSIEVPAIVRKSPYMRNLREGIDYLLRDRLLLAIAAMVIVTNLLDQAYSSVLLPVWVQKELGSPIALGTISAAFGIGAVTGNVVMAWLAPRLPRRIPFAFSFLLCGAPRFIALALAPGLSLVVAVAFVSGLGAGGINPALGAVEYERVPAQFQARVLGAINAVAWAGLPFGGLLGGALSDSIGPRAALGACGVVYLAATLSPFVFPIWRQMERSLSRSSSVPLEFILDSPEHRV